MLAVMDMKRLKSCQTRFPIVADDLEGVRRSEWKDIFEASPELMRKRKGETCSGEGRKNKSFSRTRDEFYTMKRMNRRHAGM